MKSDNEKVTEYLNHLTVEKGLAKNTLLSYRRDLERFLKYLTENSLELAKITPELMAEYVAWLRGKNSTQPPLAEASIARAVVAIRNLYAFEAKESSELNLLRDFHPPKIPKRLPKALTINDISALIAAAASAADPIAPRDAALIELLYASGARISEIVQLNLSDISKLQEANSFAIKLKGKGGKERVVPIGKYAREAIDQYLVRVRPGLLTERGNDALFLNRQGKRLSRQSAWEIITLAAARAKIEREVSPHSLRHSFATHLLDGGADIRVVQELLGHSSVTTTQIYTLITIDKLRESYSAAHPRAR
ncbi:MAG: site-specific tyrosine recombinase XerD [Actinomycetes bacterium]